MKAQSLVKHAMVKTLDRLSRSSRIDMITFSMIACHDSWRDNASDELKFLAFCGSMQHIAHGQLLQDLWVLFELDLKSNGYFVEFGAYDGSRHSNTKLLEENFGWSGVLAEPNPEMANVLRSSRSANVDARCVWDVSGDEIDLLVTGDAELSTVRGYASPDLHTDTRRATIVRTVSVPTVSLNDLLDEYRAPNTFDFMSVDTEGTELRILRSFDFTKHRPYLLAVEHNGRADEQDLDNLLFAQGYERRFRSMSRWDGWYRLRT